MLHTFTATAVEIDPNQLEIKPAMKTKGKMVSVLR
jgi:hypothetical protein